MTSKEEAVDAVQISDAKTEDDNVNFFYDLISAPCFRQSMLYGIGGGVAIGGLSFARDRNALNSAETTVKTGCAISAMSWIYCRRKYYAEREVTYDSLNRYRERASEMAAERAKALREKKDASATTDASNPKSN